MKKQTICLNMIVKNENGIIRDCLASIKPYIDTWVIVDTGSTDGTQETIVEFMKDIPGNLYEKPWKNFAQNRNEALLLAKPQADYSLIMDADDIFFPSSGFQMPKLEFECYCIVVQEPNGIESPRVFLIDNQSDLFWTGVLHETVSSAKRATLVRLEGAHFYSDTKRGARGKDPKKYLKDAQVLEEALKEDPENSRHFFYLGQSYLNGGDYISALKAYQKRIEMGGFDEEVFFSLYTVGLLQEFLKEKPEVFLATFFKAHSYRPHRTEPLFFIANHYLNRGKPESAYPLLKKAAALPRANDQLFVNPLVSDFLVFYTFSVCCSQLQRHEEAHDICRKLLKSHYLPKAQRPEVEKELREIKKRAPFLVFGSIPQPMGRCEF